jgi:hypothetical protein
MPQMTGTPNRLIQVNCDLNKTLISMCYTSQRRTPSPASAPRKGRCRERDVQWGNSDKDRLNESFHDLADLSLRRFYSPVHRPAAPGRIRA